MNFEEGQSMERNQITERLHSLVANLNEKARLEQEISTIVKKLNHEKTRPIKKVEYFDSTHKSDFIASKVGDKPVKPTKALAILVPIYVKKKKEYEAELEKYNAAVHSAEKEYYITFEKERNALIEADNNEREATIQELSAKLEVSKGKLEELVVLIEKEDIVGLSLKNILDVQLLIEIFDNKRADTVKEAVNVLFEDKHRKRMEELQEEHVRLTQEAKDAAESAADSAEKAIKIAKEALDRADEAYNKAQEAYREAEDAYSEARSAYSEATRN